MTSSIICTYVEVDRIQYDPDSNLKGVEWDAVQAWFCLVLLKILPPLPSLTIEKPTKTNKMKTEGFHPVVWRKSKISWRARNHGIKLGISIETKTWLFWSFTFQSLSFKSCFGKALFILFWAMWSGQWGLYESLVCGEYILSICSLPSNSLEHAFAAVADTEPV